MEKPRPQADPIAAVATAAGRGGIGVVRVSGADLRGLAAAIAGRVPAPRQATLATFRAADGSAIDRGVALYFSAPRSYTGEDVLELQGHGGPVVLQMLLRRCLELGARLAEPGEFSKRAFLNDKLDLAQAEAVADLIEASTEAAARSATRSLSGEFSAQLERLSGELVELRALIEATLDFPEEEVDLLHSHQVELRLGRLLETLDVIRTKAQRGAVLRQGLRVVIAGAPNVGKSSLLNRLAGEDRAIVTDLPGTTRDSLRETIQVAGIPLHVIDTAGLRPTSDPIEREGIARSWREIERADVVMLLREASRSPDPDSACEEVLKRCPPGAVIIEVLNKIDLHARSPARVESGGRVQLCLSALTGAGVELLEDELLHVAGWQQTGEDVFLARERHLQALAAAHAHLAAAKVDPAALDLAAEELRLAHLALGEITGKFTADDLLGEIFGRFCIGK